MFEKDGLRPSTRSQIFASVLLYRLNFAHVADVKASTCTRRVQGIAGLWRSLQSGSILGDGASLEDFVCFFLGFGHRIFYVRFNEAFSWFPRFLMLSPHFFEWQLCFRTMTQAGFRAPDSSPAAWKTPLRCLGDVWRSDLEIVPGLSCFSRYLEGPDMEVSWNGGTPRSWIFMDFPEQKPTS